MLSTQIELVDPKQPLGFFSLFYILIFIYLIKYETIQTYALTYIFEIGRGKKPILYVVANSCAILVCTLFPNLF